MGALGETLVWAVLAFVEEFGACRDVFRGQELLVARHLSRHCTIKTNLTLLISLGSIWTLGSIWKRNSPSSVVSTKASIEYES